MADRTCLICGEVLPPRKPGPGRNKLYCGARCKPRYGPRPQATCATCRSPRPVDSPYPSYCSFGCVPVSGTQRCRRCGSDFTGRPSQRYCSQACRLYPRNCAFCGVWFSPWNESPKQGRTRRFCSNECRHADYAQRTAAPKVPFECEWCLRSAVGQRGQRICSAQCRNRRGAHLAEHSAPDRCDVPWKPCEGCGEMGSFFHHRRFCGNCRAERRQAHWRRKNAVRRGAKVKGAKFTLRQVAERDGWKCHLCGRQVNPKLTDPDPRSATIDHLVPVSAGGLDELPNVALAHRSCNCARGAKGLAQLRLAV